MTPVDESYGIELDSGTQGPKELNIIDDNLSPNSVNSLSKRGQVSTTS